MKKSTPAAKAASVVNPLVNLTDFHSRIRRVLGPTTDLFHPPFTIGGTPLVVDESSVETTARRLLEAELFSKFDDGVPSPAKAALTMQKFREAEDLCRVTNDQLSRAGLKGLPEFLISEAQLIASLILGGFSWDLAARGFGWGPGASTRCPRRRSDAAYKYSGTPETTSGNSALADCVIAQIPSWKQELRYSEEFPHYCKVVKGNRIITVPKNWKTDRTIAIEPDMNMYVQKGIGRLMRQRLRSFGCDLNDQTINQRAALKGSISGDLATIDLSMASDTVSRQLVSRLIRSDWVTAMEHCRSPYGTLPSGEEIFYQKFSSMGNGFTFELETVIFLSLAIACARELGEETHHIAVYGDDVIVPRESAYLFCSLISKLGFKPNVKKTHIEGTYRESCGKHYQRGYDVTPFYVKRPIVKLTDLFLLHNNLRRYALRLQPVYGSDITEGLLSVCRWLRQKAPASWRRPRIPDGYGDGAFIGSFDEVLPRPHPAGWDAYEAKILSQTFTRDFIDVPGLLPKGLRLIEPLMDGETTEECGAYPAKDGRVREIKIAIPRFALT